MEALQSIVICNYSVKTLFVIRQQNIIMCCLATMKKMHNPETLKIFSHQFSLNAAMSTWEKNDTTDRLSDDTPLKRNKAIMHYLDVCLQIIKIFSRLKDISD